MLLNKTAGWACTLQDNSIHLTIVTIEQRVLIRVFIRAGERCPRHSVTTCVHSFLFVTVCYTQYALSVSLKNAGSWAGWDLMESGGGYYSSPYI